MRSFALVPLAVAVLASSAHSQVNPRDLVSKSVEALGGAKALRAVRGIKLHGIGHDFLVEESERPEGPYFANYREIDQTLDFAAHSDALQMKLMGAQFPSWMPANASVTFDSSGKASVDGIGYFAAITDSRMDLCLNPLRVMLLASAAPGLKLESDAPFQDTPHHAVSFQWGADRVTVYLNDNTMLPTAVETTDVGEKFWSAWGDVRTRIYFSNWELEPGGLRFPTLWSLERNGLRQRDTFFTKVEIETGDPSPDTDALLFKSASPIPIDQRPARTMAVPKPTEIAPGILLYQANFNCTAIVQDDGIDFLEGVNTPEYMEDVISQVQSKYPGKPLRAVVTCTDSWPHIAGLRAFAAHNVAILALDANLPIVHRILDAPHTLMPDALQQHPVKPMVVKVSAANYSGTGPNRIEIYPVRGEGGERMQVVYFPERRLLYAADLIQPNPDGTLTSPEYAGEVEDVVERYKLRVDNVFAMHSAPRPWDSVLAAVRAVKEKKG